MKGQTAEQLAEDHVEWFLKMIKPIYVEAFKHGFKHGVDSCEDMRSKQ